MAQICGVSGMIGSRNGKVDGAAVILIHVRLCPLIEKLSE